MFIYKITNIINNKSYIGQTVTSTKRRWILHKSEAKTDDTHFHRAIRKYGAESFVIEILEELDDIEFLNERERFWIMHFDTYNNGYNSDEGGGNGRHLSEEHKQKIGNSNRGRKRPDTSARNIGSTYGLGYTHSEETRIKQKEIAINRTYSSETRKKMSLSAKNRKKKNGD